MKIKTCLLGLFIIALQGCASAPVERSLGAEHAKGLNEAEVLVVVPQKEIYALFPGFSTGGSGEFGLIGRAIHAYENDKAYKNMRANVEPVVPLAAKINWARDLEAELRKARIVSNPERVKLVTLPEGEDPIGALVKSSSKPWVVVINSAYYLDAWYRVLTVGADVSLWQRGQSQPVHSFRTVYYSRPITADMEFLITGKMVPLWAQSAGEPLRKHASEGMRETANLIKTALTRRPSNLSTSHDTLQEYVDWDRIQWLTRKAKRIGVDKDRAVAIDEDGRLLSVSTGPTYASVGEVRRSVAPGMARIYVYQITGQNGFAPKVLVNGSSEGFLYPRTYVPLDVKPGSHKISLKYEGDAPGASIARGQIDGVTPVIVDAKAGDRLFVRFDGYQGIMTPDDALKSVAATDAEKELAALCERY